MLIYFISDLHLHEQSTEIRDRFLHFLNHNCVHADALYILGDFFAFWIGDDLNTLWVQKIQVALKAVSEKGTKIYILKGNRDFLLGHKFCQSIGGTLLPDPYIIEHNGQKIIISHGDIFCTHDVSYQRFRRIVQNPIIHHLFLSLPISIRWKLANWIRAKIKRASKQTLQSPTRNSNIDKFDVAEHSIIEAFEHYHASIMIHGHTHKPAIHQHQLANGQLVQRFVLGDWHHWSSIILKCEGKHFQLIDLALSERNTI